MSLIWWGAGVLGAVAAAFPFWRERRKRVIDSSARKGTGSEFAKLSQGVTAYRWYGPSRGPVIVAIHGLLTPRQTWSALAPRLGDLGYRVLTYDLWGRGLSDAPPGTQDAAFFRRQLTELLDHLELPEDLTLLGFSMGGMIATDLADTAPGRVRRMILIAPAGVMVRDSGFSTFCRTVPGVGDWLHHLLFARRTALRIAADTRAHDVPTITRVQRNELDRQGYARAVLASRRGLLAARQEEAHRRLAAIGLPIVAIWGDADEVIPLAALGRLTEWNRNVKHEVIKGADHALPTTHSAEVADLLRSVLREVD